MPSGRRSPTGLQQPQQLAEDPGPGHRQLPGAVFSQAAPASLRREPLRLQRPPAVAVRVGLQLNAAGLPARLDGALGQVTIMRATVRALSLSRNAGQLVGC